MPKPIPGQNYTVQAGDNLWNLSSMAYNDPWKWEDIFKANEVELTPSTPNKWNYIMHAGDVIFIPPDTLIDSFKTEDVAASQNDPETMGVFIDGENVPVTNGRIIRTLDKPADAFTLTTYFDPLSDVHQRIFRPYGFQKALAYLGTEKQITGRLYTPKTSADRETGSNISLKAFSPTVDIIDSNSKAPYERKNITLEERIRELVEPKGIKVIWNVEEEDKPFKKVKTTKTEKIFAHLSKLAKQRSVVISSNTSGDIVCDTITQEGSVGTMIEGQGPVGVLDGEWDGRKVYSSYTAYGTGPKKNVKAFAKNPDVPRSRMFGFTANDSDEDGIQEAADFEKNSSIADALTIPFPVHSWYAPDGSIWTPNTLMTLISPSLFLPEGFTFLIRQVEFIFSIEGSSAVLSLVPPTVFTKGELINPWAA